MIEPINRFDIPGFYLNTVEQAASIIDEVGSDNLFIQYDLYHQQRTEGELIGTYQRQSASIAHVQLADNPGRHEPGTGEINYPFVFDALDGRLRRLDRLRIQAAREPPRGSAGWRRTRAPPEPQTSSRSGAKGMATIGFIGLGIMGTPMARHLQDAGHTVITSKFSAPRTRNSSTTA